MWYDIVRHGKDSSSNCRCHSLSASYVLGATLGVFTPITLLCVHNTPKE